MNESISLAGLVKVVHTDKDGALISEFSQPNLVTTVGKVQIAQLIENVVAVTAPSHMAVGSSNTAPSVANTTLGTELARVALDSTTQSTNTVVYVATFGPGVGTGTLEEGGLFNAGAAGTMTCRTLFSASVPKAAGDTVEITWTVTVG